MEMVETYSYLYVVTNTYSHQPLQNAPVPQFNPLTDNLVGLFDLMNNYITYCIDWSTYLLTR